MTFDIVIFSKAAVTNGEPGQLNKSSFHGRYPNRTTGILRAVVEHPNMRDIGGGSASFEFVSPHVVKDFGDQRTESAETGW